MPLAPDTVNEDVVYVVKDRATGLYYTKLVITNGKFYGRLKHARMYMTQEGAQGALDTCKQAQRAESPVVVPILLIDDTEYEDY